MWEFHARKHVRGKTDKHKVRTCHGLQVVSKFRKNGTLWGFSFLFLCHFPAERCRDCLGCRMPLPSRWEGLAEQGSHPDRQWPPSSGQCWPQSPARAFKVSGSQGVEPEPKGNSHCAGPAVLEWTLISFPNHNPVWFGFVVVFTTQQEIGTRDVSTP